MGRFAIAIAIIFLGIGLITYVLGRVFRKNVFIKYIPALLLLLFGVYYIYKAYTVRNGFEDLANFLLALLLFAGAVSGTVTGLFMDFVRPGKKGKGNT